MKYEIKLSGSISPDYKCGADIAIRFMVHMCPYDLGLANHCESDTCYSCWCRALEEVTEKGEFKSESISIKRVD